MDGTGLGRFQVFAGRLEADQRRCGRDTEKSLAREKSFLFPLLGRTVAFSGVIKYSNVAASAAILSTTCEASLNQGLCGGAR